MQYNRLGGTGLKVSRLSLGAWVTYGGQVDYDGARACILAAHEAGVNFFDNAEAYAGGAAETVMGRVLKELPRESYVVSSKVFWGGEGPNDCGLNRKHVVEACDAALTRLGVDYLDLYFCHRHDPDTPMVEVVRTMNRLIDQGKVLYWGTSEWTAAQLTEAYAVADQLGLEGPAMEQPEYNMFRRERVEVELRPHIEQRGLGTTIWSPLASGLLTGKYNDGVPADSRAALPNMAWLADDFTASRIAKVRLLKPIADELGCTLAQLALAWAARTPLVSTVITGASRVSQVHENMRALDVLEQIDDTIAARIDDILAGTEA